MSTRKKNTKSKNTRQRVDDLAAVFALAHAYARVQRATRMHDGAAETDGEHALSLAMIATAYALEYYPHLDPYKVFFYGAMHDVDEFLYGDRPTLKAPLDTFAKKDVEEAEAAVKRTEILSQFPKLNAMINDLSDTSIPENAFGKAFDKLAPGYTHAANLGKVLKEDFGIYNYEYIIAATLLTDEKMHSYAADFPDIIAMRQEMHKKVAEEAFDKK